MNSQTTTSSEKPAFQSLFLPVAIMGVILAVGLKVMNSMASQIQPGDFERACNTMAGCSGGGGPVFGDMLGILLLVVGMSLIVSFFTGTPGERHSDSSSSGVTVVQEQYVNGDIETVLELESQLEDALGGDAGGVGDD